MSSKKPVNLPNLIPPQQALQQNQNRGTIPSLHHLQKPSTTGTKTYGRVAYLHFACRAPIPIGSYLRVTSSQLWAPGTLTPSDPTDARTIRGKANELALPDNMVDGLTDAAGTNAQMSYASSVEMVTSPEEWPIWRTRTPVVIALKHHHGRIEHHRYRYMVVTPGVDNHNSDDSMGDDAGELGTIIDTEDDNDVMNGDGTYGNSMHLDNPSSTNILGAATSGETGANVASKVMAWEDPFEISSTIANRELSAISLPSVRRQAISRTLANLPYRTIEIDTTTVKVKTQSDYGGNLNLQYTSNGVQIDTWNNKDDFTFCPYVLRNELNKQNKGKRQLLSNYNTSTVTIADGGGAAGSNDENSNDSLDDSRRNVPTMRSAVSFNHMIEVFPHENNQEDGDEKMDSTITSLTMSPNISKSRMSQTSMTDRARNKIFFVCFHLPVILTKDEQVGEWRAVWAESLLAATEGSNIVREYDCHWVGTVSCDVSSDEDKDSIRSVLAEMNCIPLFFDKKVKDDHYYGMCKQVLWPAFHNIDLLDLSASVATESVDPLEVEGAYRISDWDQSRLDNWWKAYTTVNIAFAEALDNLLLPGDIMWVHDYHLSLLPKMVSDIELAKNNGKFITKKIFLLHIPFPTSQVFRELECGESILQGMLHADVVGFHAYDHARHFLKASKRIFGLNFESLIGGLIGVQFGKRTVLVTMHNVSIEPLIVDAALDMPSVAEIANKLRQDHSSRKIIGGIDIAQRLSGIVLKLVAYEHLLADYPIWRDNLVMIQKCLIPGSRLDDEARSMQEIRFIVKRIKQRFGPHVINCEEIYGSSLPIDQRLALYKVTDVFMVTPIREGLNLLPLEYVYTKKKPSPPGVIISSEFSAVSSVLNGALRVNPYDIQMTVFNIDKALQMTYDDKEGRRIRDQGFVSSSSSSKWTQHVLDDLHDATAYAVVSDDESDDTSMMGTKYEKKDSITSTASFLAQEHDIGFSYLDMTSVYNAFKTTKKRVLLLDLNGTIVFKEAAGKYLKRDTIGSSGMLVEEQVSKALMALCADPNNTVFVVSGDSQENVEKAIGHIHGLGIAASNGACFAPPLKVGETSRRWKYFDLGVDWDAVKAIVMPILAKFTSRSNGSFIKLTHSSIGWSYYSCDPEWGSLQASHLVLELEYALRAFDVRFVMIKGIVEIVPRLLNKGLIVKNVLREAQQNGEVDFILCMGDDIQDEKMFTSVFTFLAELDDPDHIKSVPPVVDGSGTSVSATALMSDQSHHRVGMSSLSISSNRKSETPPKFAFTVTVGKKESHAIQYVDDAKDVAKLLEELAVFYE